MTTGELLIKMRAWIEAEIEKAKKPYQDKFLLTSLSYAASKCMEPAADWELQEKTLAEVHSITTKRTVTHDVFTPREALALLDAALELIY